MQRTQRPVSFRLLASVADITQGDLDADGADRRPRTWDESRGPDPSARCLRASCSRALDCAIHYATELVPEEQRTRVRTAFSRETFEALDERERRGVTMLADGLADNWSLDGLTTLIYAVPKRLLGLPADAEPDAEVKAPAAGVLQGRVPVAVRRRDRAAATDAAAVDRPRPGAHAARRRLGAGRGPALGPRRSA